MKRPEPHPHFWRGPGGVVILGELGYGGRGNKISFVLSRLPLCPPPLPASIPAIDYIQFLHKEKKKQEEEVSILRKEVTALKIMKV